MDMFGDPNVWLPLAFAGLMGLSILVYVVLDGFDLGVGNLFLFAGEKERDRMIASIGPFWDANETWLVMAVGLLLVAFPAAHGTILTALYLPVAVMLLALIGRGVAFEFRVKAPAGHKFIWDAIFFAGSLATSLSQGFMLGLYIMGLQWRPETTAFATLTALCLALGYSFIGAAWLIGKTEGELQKKAVTWAQRCLWGVAAGVAAVSVATPLVSPRIFARWFEMPQVLLLAPLPIISIALVLALRAGLQRLPAKNDVYAWAPFCAASGLFSLAFLGLAYSFYPYVVPGKLTIYEAASAPESLIIILVGALIVLPVIVAYSILAYTVFRGKARDLTYD
ncbi:MAG: cytochrome d ubiquinol oxidase subunit II [Pseudomonadota bacterium]